MHASFEGLGSMESYFNSEKYNLSSSLLYEKDYTFPAIEEIDWLIIMGGPMGVYDTEDYPWLVPEKAFIKSAIDAGKIVVGVCLGAQLIADVLGAKVYKNKHREIGWFNLTRSSKAINSKLRNIFPQKVNTFHWHGDTFDLPENALLLVSSEACINQAFSINNRIFGFQFHFEATLEFAESLLVNCANELDGSEYVQSRELILSDRENYDKINAIMNDILRAIES
jgi:GMP synthase (glutamine-hydrolysing)